MGSQQRKMKKTREGGKKGRRRTDMIKDGREDSEKKKNSENGKEAEKRSGK